MAHVPQYPKNPCSLAEEEKIAAKIWELLRRNAKFRAVVQRLRELEAKDRENQAKTGEYHGSAWYDSCKLVDNAGESHPFAGVALKWLVPDPRFIVQRQLSHGVVQVGEGTTPDTEDKAHWRWWNKACQANHAGRLSTRGPVVHWTNGRANSRGDKENPLLQWQQFKWPFTVEHSWKAAPPTFRREFQFIWRSRYDCRPKNPVSKDRSDSPRPHESEFFQGWRLEDFRASGKDNVSRVVKVLKFNELADNYRLFAIPKTILTKASADAMSKWLSDELKKGSSLYGDLLKGKLLNEAELLGTASEWTDWQNREEGKLRGIFKDTHFYSRCSYMDSLVALIYPNFEISKLLAPPQHRARGKQYVRK